MRFLSPLKILSSVTDNVTDRVCKHYQNPDDTTMLMELQHARKCVLQGGKEIGDTKDGCFRIESSCS